MANKEGQLVHKPVKEIQLSSEGSSQKVYRFKNNYGASVVRSPTSYGGREGLLELAVIKFKGKSDDFKINYRTPITSDVIGYLTTGEVEDILTRIEGI